MRRYLINLKRRRINNHSLTGNWLYFSENNQPDTIMVTSLGPKLFPREFKIQFQFMNSPFKAVSSLVT